MIGYQNPEQGNQRRKALAQYLKGQGEQRASAASRMKAFGRSDGAGTNFQRGSGKASPEKFAFAGRKPSLKTLLGLVGENMGHGGAAGTRFFSPDLPVGGLPWGGMVPSIPDTPADTNFPTAPYGDYGVPSFTGSPLPQPDSGAYQQSIPSLGETFNNGLLTYSPSPTPSSGTGPLSGLGTFWGGIGQAQPGPGGFTGPSAGMILPGYGGGGYSSPLKPLLGDLIYGDLYGGSF